MKNILSSATRLVLLYITLVLGILTTFAGVVGIWRGTLEPKEVITLFGTIITFVIGYYFSSKKADPVSTSGTSSPVVD